MRTNLTDLHKKLLILCSEDHVGLWYASLPVNEKCEGLSLDEKRNKTIILIQDLLEAGLIQAGFPTSDGRGFVPWALSVAETISRIQKEWDALGREPTIGEIVWFTTTDIGDKLASSLNDY